MLIHIMKFVGLRPEGSGEIRYAEASMMNGFGLKYIYRFFNLPFLTLQVSSASKISANHLRLQLQSVLNEM